MTLHTASDTGSQNAVAITRRHWAALVVLAAALVLDAGSVAVVNPALPEIGGELSMNEAALQWTMTSYAIAFAGFLLFGGRAADVLGRRLIFSVGVGLFTFSAVVAMIAPTAGILIAARAGQGLGAALSGPASLALVTQLFPEGPMRNRALAIYTSVGAASFSGGLVLGGALTSAFGWRSVFVVSATIGLPVLVAARALLPASTRHRQGLDLPGAVIATAGLVLAVYGVNQAATAGWDGLDTLITMVTSVVLLIAFVFWERRAADPLLPLTIFRSAPVRAATLAAVAFFTPLLGVLFFAPLYMQEVLGYTPFESGAAILPMGLLVIVSANIAGRILTQVGHRPLIVGGLVLIAVGVGGLWARTPLDATYWVDIFPAVAVMSVGQGFAFAALTVASMTGVPQDQHGVASGFNVTAQQIGGSVGVAALVTVANSVTVGDAAADRLAGYHAAYIAGAGAAMVGAIIIALGSALGRRHRRSRDADDAGSAAGAAARPSADTAARQIPSTHWVAPTPCCSNNEQPDRSHLVVGS